MTRDGHPTQWQPAGRGPGGRGGALLAPAQTTKAAQWHPNHDGGEGPGCLGSRLPHLTGLDGLSIPVRALKLYSDSEVTMAQQHRTARAKIRLPTGDFQLGLGIRNLQVPPQMMKNRADGESGCQQSFSSVNLISSPL